MCCCLCVVVCVLLFVSCCLCVVVCVLLSCCCWVLVLVLVWLLVFDPPVPPLAPDLLRTPLRKTPLRWAPPSGAPPIGAPHQIQKWMRKTPLRWAPPSGAPPFGAPPFGARIFLGLGSTMTHQIQKWIGQIWPGQNRGDQKWIGPNRIGPNWSNQDGQNGIGQSRSLPLDHPTAGSLKISLFFPFPASIFALFCLSLGVFQLNFGQFGLSDCLGKPCRLWGRRSFTRQPENQSCTFQGPGASKHQNSTRRHPERQKERKGGRVKKARNFGLPTLRGPTLRGPRLRGPALRGPTFSRFGPPPFGLHQLWSMNSTPKSKLVEVEIGRSRKNGRSRVCPP